jgi:YidC/Oxa1 family membrane protein insertase
MGQQFYVIRNNPQPGTPAFEAKEARKKEKAAKKAARKSGGLEVDATEEELEVTDTPSERQQPKKTSRSKRKKKK